MHCFFASPQIGVEFTPKKKFPINLLGVNRSKIRNQLTRHVKPDASATVKGEIRQALGETIIFVVDFEKFQVFLFGVVALPLLRGVRYQVIRSRHHARFDSDYRRFIQSDTEEVLLGPWRFRRIVKDHLQF